GVPLGQRALVAYRQKLAGKARDLLLDSHISAFGPQGMALELELLLKTGQPEKVWEWTSPEHRETLGPSYYWLRIAALGAMGDYELARKEFEQFLEVLAVGPQGEPVEFRKRMMFLIASRVLDENGANGSMGEYFFQVFRRKDFVNQLWALAESLKHEANLLVLDVLLALEEGDSEWSESAFRRALANWVDDASAASGGGLDFAGRTIAQSCLEWLH